MICESVHWWNVVLVHDSVDVRFKDVVTVHCVSDQIASPNLLLSNWNVPWPHTTHTGYSHLFLLFLLWFFHLWWWWLILLELDGRHSPGLWVCHCTIAQLHQEPGGRCVFVFVSDIKEEIDLNAVTWISMYLAHSCNCRTYSSKGSVLVPLCIVLCLSGNHERIIYIINGLTWTRPLSDLCTLTLWHMSGMRGVSSSSASAAVHFSVYSTGIPSTSAAMSSQFSLNGSSELSGGTNTVDSSCV